jgi:predicted AAA+ superfamily ATPase
MDVVSLLQRISIRKSLRPDWENTLLFIDEIQELPEAIQILRYFYEEYPQLSVIAAGSLLEFALGEVKSFPVGRVEFLYLYPLCFEEFLGALGKTPAQQAYNQIPVPAYAVDELQKLYNAFCLLGGMPEVVARYCEDETFLNTRDVYESIWQTYQSDVEKYGSNPTAKRMIRHVMRTAPASFDKRITFQNFGQSTYKSREIGEAFRQLHDAGIVHLVYPTTMTSAPLTPDFRKSPRMQFLDTGLLLNRLGLLADLIGLADLSDGARGALIPHSIFQERMALQSHTNRMPFFWVREKTQSSAEVDLLLQKDAMVIPVEIKSGSIGKLRSLHSFMELSSATLAIRLYQGKPEVDTVKLPSGKSYTLLSLPYFLAARLEDYVDASR